MPNLSCYCGWLLYQVKNENQDTSLKWGYGEYPLKKTKFNEERHNKVIIWRNGYISSTVDTKFKLSELPFGIQEKDYLIF